MGFVGILAGLLALVLFAGVIASLLRALPLILLVVVVGLLLRWYVTGSEEAVPRSAKRSRQGRWSHGPADAVRTVPESPAESPPASAVWRRFLVRYPADAVHDAIEKAMAAVGAKVRWDPRDPRLAEGTVTEGRFLGVDRYVQVAFGPLPRDGCWVSVAGDSVELLAQFERAMDELIGPTRELVDESETAWCRRFNEAMARQGDSTRIYPDRWICPNCGAAIVGGPSCGRCGARIEAAR